MRRQAANLESLYLLRILLSATRGIAALAAEMDADTRVIGLFLQSLENAARKP